MADGRLTCMRYSTIARSGCRREQAHRAIQYLGWNCATIGIELSLTAVRLMGKEGMQAFNPEFSKHVRICTRGLGR